MQILRIVAAHKTIFTKKLKYSLIYAVITKKRLSAFGAEQKKIMLHEKYRLHFSFCSASECDNLFYAKTGLTDLFKLAFELINNSLFKTGNIALRYAENVGNLLLRILSCIIQTEPHN